MRARPDVDPRGRDDNEGGEDQIGTVSKILVGGTGHVYPARSKSCAQGPNGPADI